MNVEQSDRLDEIKYLLSQVDDRIGPDSSLRWLIKEVDRLRAQQDKKAEELKVLYTLLERIVARLGEAFVINPVITDPDQLTSMAIHRWQGVGTELAEIHDLAAEALGYQRAPSLEEDPNCPCPNSFITGDHTAQTLVMELVKKYKGDK